MDNSRVSAVSGQQSPDTSWQQTVFRSSHIHGIVKKAVVTA